ncbi:MAG TPA: pyrroline-5-carboxylate reductase [Bellilinea sp.]|nr:pyrroline-5-carboxylate reductase [Bellilinea sp.]
MKKNPNIAIIGPGVMAEAIIKGLIKQKMTLPKNITAGGPRTERGEELKLRHHVQFETKNAAAVKNADIVLLTVKPQRLTTVMKDLKGNLPAGCLVISIVAGKTLETLSAGLGHDQIVRVMPNTPAQIGQGISVWIASEAVTNEQRTIACSILQALGDEINVEDENFLDMATALSGSGPSYVFLFMEALIDAGVHMGFPRRISEQLVVQTIRGSVEYYSTKSNHPATLRNEVTSPGGTSAEALYYLEKAGFRTALSRAIWAAYERSQQLGSNKPRESIN